MDLGKLTNEQTSNLCADCLDLLTDEEAFEVIRYWAAVDDARVEELIALLDADQEANNHD